MIALLDNGQPDWAAIGAALAAPFDARDISFKPSKVFADKGNDLRGSCTAMAYLDARAVQERLDTVVGPANWVFHWEPIIIGPVPDSFTKGDHLLVVRGTLTIYGVPKQDVGTASNSDPDKGAVSDTLKRCFVMWGGAHDLYDLPTLYMNMERNGTGDKDKWRPVKNTNGDTEQERLRKKLIAHRAGQTSHDPPAQQPQAQRPAPQQQQAARPAPAQRQPPAPVLAPVSADEERDWAGMDRNTPTPIRPGSPLLPRMTAALARLNTTLEALNARRAVEQKPPWETLPPSQQEQLVEHFEKKAVPA